jgi:hypothetical protein
LKRKFSFLRLDIPSMSNPGGWRVFRYAPQWPCVSARHSESAALQQISRSSAFSCTAQGNSIQLSPHRFQLGHLRYRCPQLLGIEGRKRTDAIAAGERRGFAKVRIFDVGIGQLALAQIQLL